MVEYKYMNTHEQPLVGPQAEDRDEQIDAEMTGSGQPLWMAFLADPEALTVSKEEVQDAKNALQRMQSEKPDTISLCKHKTIEECRDMIHPAQAA